MLLIFTLKNSWLTCKRRINKGKLPLLKPSSRITTWHGFRIKWMSTHWVQYKNRTGSSMISRSHLKSDISKSQGLKKSLSSHHSHFPGISYSFWVSYSGKNQERCSYLSWWMAVSLTAGFKNGVMQGDCSVKNCDLWEVTFYEGKLKAGMYGWTQPVSRLVQGWSGLRFRRTMKYWKAEV